MTQTLRALPVVAVLLFSCGRYDVCGGDACPAPASFSATDGAVTDAGAPPPLSRDGAGGGGSATSTGAGGGGGGGGSTLCVPSCQMKVCGPDGCGGTCGGCTAPETCNASGHCACTPESDAAFCAREGSACGPITGSDNCGHLRSVASCGTCSAPTSCVSGHCACVPQCNGKVCGPDGCGGTCGGCPGNATCDATQTGCFCDDGFLPAPDQKSCVAKGSSSSALAAIANYPRNGYCIGGQLWVVPDPVRGLIDLDCGPGQCRLDGDPNNSGSCSCGASGTTYPTLTDKGTCVPGDVLGNGFGQNEVLLGCFFGHAYWDNCVADTGRSTGLCSTFVTSFGWTSSCYCAPCQDFSFSSNTCKPTCGTWATCSYSPTSSITSCY